MIISLGSSPRVIESINRKYKFTKETYFFDNILTNFETVLHFIKHIDNPINSSDLYNSGIENHSIGSRIINHNSLRLTFTSGFSLTESYKSYIPIFLELINRRLRKFKSLIMNNSFIEFVHCLDDKDNYKFECSKSYRNSNLYIPTNQMIHDFVHYVKEINPQLQFNLHLLVHPVYGNDNRDILNTLSNPHLKIHYMTQESGRYLMTAGDMCIHWHWDKVYDTMKNNINIKLPYDFDPVFYKRIYPDLAHLTDKGLEQHYVNNGIKEDRVYKIDQDIKFDPAVYKRIYEDLSHMTDEEARIHYICNGIRENRKYKYEDVFDAKKYKELYPDLEHMDDREATQHFYLHGINEGRSIC
jgi:hypothetical protein